MARASLTAKEIKAQLAAADRAPREGVRATGARYDVASGRVEVELDNGCMFAFPAALGQGLQGASAEELIKVTVSPSGLGLHWEALDVQLLVPALFQGQFGSRRWMSELGRELGKATSPAKAAASRANGKRGGRPRKASGGV